MNIIQTIKDHPLPILGGVVILLLLMRGSSSSPVAVTTGNSEAYALQSQKLAGDVNVALGTVNAQESTKRAAIAADMYKVGAQTAATVAAADSKSFVESFMANLSASSAKYIADNQLKATQVSQQLQRQTAAQSINADVTKAQLSANSQMMQFGIAKDLGVLAAGNEAAKISNDRYALDLQNKQINIIDNRFLDVLKNNQALAIISADNSQKLATISGNTALGLATQSGQTAVNLALINGQTAKDITTITGKTNETLAKINTEAANTKANAEARKSDVNGVTSLLQLGASLFGF